LPCRKDELSKKQTRRKKKYILEARNRVINWREKTSREKKKEVRTLWQYDFRAFRTTSLSHSRIARTSREKKGVYLKDIFFLVFLMEVRWW